MAREEQARQIIESLQGEDREYAIDKIRESIDEWRNVKRNSNSGAEMGEIERALKILYNALENL